MKGQKLIKKRPGLAHFLKKRDTQTFVLFDHIEEYIGKQK